MPASPMLDLVEIPENPIPPGAGLHALTAQDGVSLRMASFPAEGTPRGTLALFQGRAEYIEKYFETISEMQTRGFDVVTLDWRGQGGSERALDNARKGHVDDFSQYQRDIAALIEKMKSLNCPRPWFALAHSTGGSILLEYLHNRGAEFSRVIVTAPLIDIHGLRFPGAARLLANTLDTLGLGAMFIPGGREASLVELAFEDNKLTSDPRRLARNAAILAKEPRLSVGDPSVGWVNAAFRQMKRFEQPDYSRGFGAPLLIVAMGRDEIVSTAAIERFAQRLDIATLIRIPGARHEILMERDDLRQQFYAAFDAFIPGVEGSGEATRAAE